ncbi:hypothetical protein [Propionicimonas sp.]|uniref:hypothetical protein n=1 Tax=Propionicimonas sp. TaxID=1955623 RepID=UPI0039E55C1D
MPEQTVFTHNSSLYASRVYGEGILAAVVAVVSVERLVNGGAWSMLWLIPLVVGTYAALRLLLTGSVPRTIELTGDQLVLSDARKSRTYALADLQEFRVREFRASDTIYLRLQPRGGREQKYWIEWKAYSDSDELVAGIRAIDMRLHPDSLKVRAGLTGYTPAEGTRHA